MMKKGLIAAAIALLTTTVQAGLLPTTVTVTPEAGNYRWTYAIVLPTDMKLQSGNYFTIYDFEGYIPGGESAPSGWTFSSSDAGGTPSGLLPNDDPTKPNLTWTYTGETTFGQVGLGNFWAVSSSGNSKEDAFTAKTNRASDGLTDSNITTTDVPMASEVPPPGVPEPATLALAGLGLPIVFQQIPPNCGKSIPVGISRIDPFQSLLDSLELVKTMVDSNRRGENHETCLIIVAGHFCNHCARWPAQYRGHPRGRSRSRGLRVHGR